MKKFTPAFDEFAPAFWRNTPAFPTKPTRNLTMPKFTLHFFVTLLKNSTDKISLTKRLYILPLQR